MHREIVFQVELEGAGVVQKDQAGQQYMYIKSQNATNLSQLGNDNITFAKANFYKNPNYTGEDKSTEKQFIRKIKISGAGLRHAIHAATMPFHSPQFFQNNAIRWPLMASMDYILRGYMYAPRKGSQDGENIRRASAYEIGDAEECSGAQSTMEVRTTSGMRTDTSLFYDETIGKTKYSTLGVINLAQLQFISASANADRMALSADDLPFVSTIMKKQYGEDSVKEGYYYLNGAVEQLAEKGLLLSDELVNKMVSHLFVLISNLYIGKQSAFVKVSKITAKFISDPTNDFVSDSNGWFTVFDTKEGIKHFNVDVHPHHFYSETTLEEIEKHNRIAEDISQRVEAAIKQAAIEKKNKKAEKNNVVD